MKLLERMRNSNESINREEFNRYNSFRKEIHEQIFSDGKSSIKRKENDKVKNEKAKMNRIYHKFKEDEVAMRAAFLERENLRLKMEIASLNYRIENMN